MQTIYNKYKERFIEISGRNRSLFTKNIIKKYSFDFGSIYSYLDTEDFYNFIWHKRETLSILNDKIVKKIVTSITKKSEDEESAEQLKKPILRAYEDIKYLNREVLELQSETGKYDLYLGFPYVFGKIGSDMQIKAPLCLFPVTIEIEKDSVIMTHIPNQPITINKSLILAYCKEYNIANEKISQEFYPNNENSFKHINEIIDYLVSCGVKIKNNKRVSLLPFDQSKEVTNTELEVKNMAVLGRFPLANPIYDDYLTLEKNSLSSPAIDLLLKNKQPPVNKKKTIDKKNYIINDLDYAQENAISSVNSNSNIVIYGPPGTGKSQTIVNIISDALCKKKRVLVVSQKQAALDVVYSRLGKLNTKAMIIPDAEKFKTDFYEKLKIMHGQSLRSDNSQNLSKYYNFEDNINNELSILQKISDALSKDTEFGINLQQMYAQSYNIGKDSKDYKLYTELQKTSIISKKYEILREDIDYIKDKNITKLYLTRKNLIAKNPLILHIRTDLDMHQIKETQNFLTKVISNKKLPFDFSKYKHSRHLASFYLEKPETSRPDLVLLSDMIAKIERPELAKWYKYSMFPLLFPVYPFVRKKFISLRTDINIDLNIALKGMKDYTEQFAPLQSVLSAEGYSLTIGGILNGNYTFIKLLLDAINNYLAVKDMNKTIAQLSENVSTILDFCYDNSNKTLANINSILNMILPMRIYHEIIKNDRYIEEILSDTINFESIRDRVLKLKTEQRSISKELALLEFSTEYKKYFEENNNNDFLYQIKKQRGLWPIRRTIEFFSDYLFRLFPCWLVSPQTVSSIFPLQRDLFDLVIFDEASQIFIENAIPTIYRGTNIVVAGDNKQLRPSSGFVKRYSVDDSFDYNIDLSTQAALEVESLLDLATAKFNPVNLTYHYRSKYNELIDFSNVAFYDNRLQIVPNITYNKEKPPIERIKVKGKWLNRHNHEEATAIVKLVKDLLRDRTNNETIGIVTFNVEQKEYIEDLLDAECNKINTFRKAYFAEKNRYEDGENKSLFVKNLENVQGDERDIIIFSIGYARNEDGKLVAQFGTLSTDGGENRLNVAITRAKKKIYVVTSIEPEELDRVDLSKNNGPKLLRKYLQYSRAVSENKVDEVKSILATFPSHQKAKTNIGAYEEYIKEELESLGYKVFTNLGNTNYKLSLGIYDEELNRFILGIECDYSAYQSSSTILESDIYRIKFLETRGWKVIRIWSRDWWQSRQNVLKRIQKIILAEREKYLNN